MQAQMNPQNAVALLTRSINADLCQAITYYEMFAPSGLYVPLIERVNHDQIHEGFNVVSEALELGVIATLCRIWDKRSGTARIPEVASRLRKNPDVVRDQTAFAQWQADVEKFEKSDHLKVLRAFRNVGLAHSNDPNLPDPRSKSNTRRVVDGDSRIVLEGTIPIVHRLNSLIVGLLQSPDFQQQRQDWQRRAEKFWDALAR
jgi:hypothetical protein